METVNLTRNMGCVVSAETYLEVMKLAEKRGVTISELLRHFIEGGLTSTTADELRELNMRLSTIEKTVIELYEMALVNWAAVKKPARTGKKAALPLTPNLLEVWKIQLKKRGKTARKTGYEQLKEASEQADFAEIPSPDDDEIQAILRDMWKADGSWSEQEEAEYQERLKEKVGIKAKTVPQKRSPKRRKLGKPRQT